MSKTQPTPSFLFTTTSNIIDKEPVVSDSNDPDQPSSPSQCFTLDDLIKEREVFRCSVLVYCSSAPQGDLLPHLPLSSSLSPPSGAVGGLDEVMGSYEGKEEEVFSHLILQGGYGGQGEGGIWEDALSLAHVCWKGSELTSRVERALASLASYCARAQINTSTLTPTLPTSHHESASRGGLSSTFHPVLTKMLLAAGGGKGGGADEEEEVMGRSMIGSRACPSWTLLRSLTMSYERAVDPETRVLLHGGRVKAAVLHSILKVDRRISIPPWLMDLYSISPSCAMHLTSPPDPSSLSSLLVTLVSYDRLQEAVSSISLVLSSWSKQDPRVRTRGSAATFVPHHAIARVRARLLELSSSSSSSSGGEEGGVQRSKGLLERLDECVEAHLDLVARDSSAAVATHGFGASTSAGGARGGFGSTAMNLFPPLPAPPPPPTSLLWSY